MAAAPGLAVRALWPVVDGLRALGQDPAAILQSVGLVETDLKEPDGRTPHPVVMALWANAEALTGDSDVGLHVAERASLASFDLHACVMSASPTLGEAYRRLCRYQRLIHDATSVELNVEAAVATLRHSLPGGLPVPRQPAEFPLAAWTRIGRRITGRDWDPLAVRFAHAPPPNTAEHRRVFRVPPQFGAPDNSLLFPAALLDAVCLTADSGLLLVLSRYADEVLARLPKAANWSDRVRHTAAGELRGGNPAADNVAAKLGLSARTLHRRLAAERVSYSELLGQLRHELAARYLGETPLSIAEVAFLLGYSEATSFHRSFKRWSGVTPAEFRRRARNA